MKNRWGSFQAKFCERSMEHVNRIFDASARTVLAEVTQNARRAGTDEILIELQEEEDKRTKIRVEDHGCGIVDPSVLLEYGRSRWIKEQTQREEPAGMGMLSMAAHGCTIRSATRQDRGKGFEITLEPDHFNLGKEAKASPWQAPEEDWHGTIVECTVRGELYETRMALENVARYHRTVFRYEGKELSRGDFLAGASHIEEWRGVRIGVVRHGWSGSNVGYLNFHGVVARGPGEGQIQEIQDEFGTIWTVRIDVVDAPGLELVLPTRTRLVQSTFLSEMEHEARLAILRALATERPPVVVKKQIWDEAKAAGIDWPEPEAMLRPYQILSVTGTNNVSPMEEIDEHVVICEKLSTADDHTLGRALDLRTKKPFDLYEPRPMLKGYKWYDEIPRIKSVESIAKWNDGEELRCHEIDRFWKTAPDRRPDDIEVKITLDRSSGASTSTMETDVAFLEADGYLEGEEYLAVLVTKSSRISAADLAELCVQCYFRPDDNGSYSDSFETQYQKYLQETIRGARGMLEDGTKALLEDVREAAQRSIVSQGICFGRGVRIDITDDNKVSVSLLETTQEV